MTEAKERFNIEAGTVDTDFPDLYSVVEYINKTPRRWDRNSSDSKKADRFHELKSFKQAMNYMEKGGYRPELQDEYDQEMSAQTAMHIQKLAIEAAPVGFRPNVPSFCADEMESAMLTAVYKDSSQKIVRLCINQSYSCGVEQSKIFALGREVVRSIGRLESAGYALEIILVSATGLYSSELGKRVLQNHEIIAKPAGAILDIQELMFALVCPDFFRRIGFAIMERTPRDVETSCYGYPSDVPDDYKKQFDLYLGACNNNNQIINHKKKLRDLVDLKLTAVQVDQLYEAKDASEYR